MDSADLATVYIDQAMTRALKVLDGKKKEDIALAEDCDGRCEQCDNEIPEERRRLVPTNLCVDCQSLMEQKNKVHGA